MQKTIKYMMISYIIIGIIAGIIAVTDTGSNSEEVATFSHSEIIMVTESASEIIDDDKSTSFETADNITLDTPSGEELCTVNNEKVNMRIQPKGDSKILYIVLRGQPGTLLEKGESWSLVRFNDKEGYVGNDYLVLQSENPEEYESLTSNYIPPQETTEPEEISLEIIR